MMMWLERARSRDDEFKDIQWREGDGVANKGFFSFYIRSNQMKMHGVTC